MLRQPFRNISKNQLPGLLLVCCVLVYGCKITSVRKPPADKPFLFKNSITLNGGKFTRDERTTVKQRLNSQLDDSSKIRVKEKFLFLRYIVNPPVYDTAASARSARNMETSMLHIGYYKSKAAFTDDTNKVGKQRRVDVKYTVEAGKPTLIDTVQYIMRKPDLQELALQNKNKTLLVEGNPVTKAAVLGEIGRMVDVYRNNGYYKFTSEELRVRGDTTVAALTTITDDIFEQLRLLAEAQAARDSPTIKLAVILNPPTDSSKLRKYYINEIYILPDFLPGDNLRDTAGMVIRPLRRRVDPKCKSNCRYDTLAWVHYHKKLFRHGFLSRSLAIKRGDHYKQDDFYNTISNYSKTGVWQSVNIQVIERKGDSNKIDLVVQLIPGKQFGFEAAVEASYSANSNTNNVTAVNSGNLLGLSGNVSLLNRNFGKEAIRMTNSVRAGVEFNFRSDSSSKKNLINSNELSYSNSIVFPRFIFPFKSLNRDKRFKSTESFINTNLSYINRINLFSLQSVNLAVGYNWNSKNDRVWTYKPLNIEFARLYNETDSFKRTLDQNPFLRYSFNTALVMGSSLGYRSAKVSPRHPNWQRSFRFNIEESGLIWGRLNVFNKYLRQFVRTDAEYIFTITQPKSAIVFRLFGGVGVPFKRDTTLPFFKQYFGGGSNSMRGWPVRGIGRGSQPLAPYNGNRFNDRTGDIQLEANLEYRYNIAQIIPNSLVLKGALFIDAGNVWNLRNSKPDGSTDSAQFNIKNLYRDLGISAGTGFRLDFNYFVLRFDLGFRFKRPELAYINNGWKAPPIGFNDFFQKLFARGTNDEYRKWRYENFNFTIGISYPF